MAEKKDTKRARKERDENSGKCDRKKGHLNRDMETRIGEQQDGDRNTWICGASQWGWGWGNWGGDKDTKMETP